MTDQPIEPGTRRRRPDARRRRRHPTPRRRTPSCPPSRRPGRARQRRRRARGPSRRRWAVALAGSSRSSSRSAPRPSIALVGRRAERDRPRLRAGRQRRCTASSGWTSRATRPQGRGVPLAVPGLRRPGVHPDRSSTRRSTRSSASLERQADVQQGHQAVVRRRARVQRRRRCPIPRPSRGGSAGSETHALLLLSVKDAAAGPGLVRPAVRRQARPPHHGRLLGHDHHALNDAGDAAGRHGHHRRQGRRDRRSRRRSRPRSTPTAHGAFANEPGPKAAFAASDSDHLGLVYIALGPLVRLVASMQSSMLSALGARGRHPGAAGRRPERDGRRPPARVGHLHGQGRLGRPGRSRPSRRRRPRPSARPATAPRTSSSTSRPTRDRAAVANDYGATLQQGIDLYKAQPCFKDAIDPAREGGRPGRWPRRHPRLDRRHRHRRQRHGPAARGGHRGHADRRPRTPPSS